MATHCLVLSGQRARNADYAMFPGQLSGLNDTLKYRADLGSGLFCVTRRLDFDAGSLVTNPNVPASISPENWGSVALHRYIADNQIAANDVMQILELPRLSSLLQVHWQVIKPITPFTFDIKINGRSASGPALTLLANQSGTTAASGVIDVTAANTNALCYFDQNDVLEVVPKTLPAYTVAANGENQGGLIGSAIVITAVGIQYERG